MDKMTQWCYVGFGRNRLRHHGSHWTWKLGALDTDSVQQSKGLAATECACSGLVCVLGDHTHAHLREAAQWMMETCHAGVWATPLLWGPSFNSHRLRDG
eukprot:3215857-Alexandrium_andersonii.AAC.1